MNEDFNPGPVSENPPDSSGDRLASALEDLIQERTSRAGTSLPDSTSQQRDRARADAPTELCPEPGDWALLLGGEPHPGELAKVSALLAHAAGCRVCAGRLLALQADESPEER